MSNITVDQFVIEMSLQETVLRSLQQLERKIVPVANRMERTLNKTFSRDYSRGMNRTFSNIERKAQQTARSVNRSLTQAFQVGSANSGLFSVYEREGRAATRRVSQWMCDAYRVPRENMPPAPTSTHRPAGQPRLTPRQRIEHLSERARTSALYSRLQLRDDGSSQRYNSRLQLLQMEYSASENLRGFQSNLRRLNFEFSSQLRVASQARASQRLAAMESNNLGSALGGISSAAIPLAGAFIALHKGMQFLQESLEEGAKRQQAQNMLLSSYGSPQAALKATLDAGDISEHYGLDTVTVRQQLAQLRATMPKSVLSDDRLSQFYANESVFAHNSGMSQDDQFGLNRALQQIAASPKLNMQDWNQVIQRSPALVNKVAQQLGVDSSKVRSELKKLNGQQVAKLLMDAMVPTPEEERRARDNILAARGRMMNAEKYAMDKTFRGYQSHLTTLFDSLASTFNNSGGLFERGGNAIGWFLDRLNDTTKTLDNVAMNIDGFMGLIGEKWDKFYSELSPSTQKALNLVKNQFNIFFDWLLVTASAALAIGGAKLGGRLIGIGRNAASAGTAATAEAGGMAIGSTAGKVFGIAAASYIGVELGNLIFDKWIPEFQKYAAKQFGWGGASGTETTHGGNTIKDSPVDWLFTKIGNVWDGLGKGGLKDPALMGYNPYAAVPPAKQHLTVTQEPIQIAPFKINIPLPDGNTYTQMITPIVQQQIQQQHELQMMSATGLQGSWQGAGNNAGFNPSLLRKS